MTLEPGRTGGPRLHVLPTPDEVADAAAAEIAEVLAGAIAARGVAHWATTGGSSAPGLYRRLGRAPLRDRVDWSRVHAWWGDDRFVPYDHPDSNVLPLEEILLSAGGTHSGQSGYRMDTPEDSPAGIEVPRVNLHRWPIAQAIGRAAGPDWAAARYEQELRDHLPAGADGLPVFDLVLLGMGPDGHVLSVFPGSAVWDAEALCAAVPAPSHVGPHVERVTLHPRLLAAARAVLLVTTGPGKAEALARGWTGDDVRELPIRAARGPNATWLVDEAAAAGLPSTGSTD